MLVTDEPITFGSVMLGIAGIIGFILLLGLYFVPTIEARRRRHPAIDGICVLNLFLGWTAIGWIIAFIWANSVPASTRTAPTAGRFCSNCGKPNAVAAMYCVSCGSRIAVSS